MIFRKTLVKSKIVLEDNGTCLTIYFWKRTFLFFGYWYPYCNCSSLGVQPIEKIEKINDDEVSKVLYKFI